MRAQSESTITQGSRERKLQVNLNVFRECHNIVCTTALIDRIKENLTLAKVIKRHANVNQNFLACQHAVFKVLFTEV